nr:hypothetical protein GCM10020093_003290 [Planobispora longispora]
MKQSLSRRVFMSVAAAGASGLVLNGTGQAAGVTPAMRSRALAGDPFILGVASGDPSQDGVVLWTRLALDPFGLNGRGAMPARDVEVRWQLAADERFTKVVRSGSATAGWQRAHSVHVELEGLEPGREYYRFRAEGHLSPPGRTRTAPAADAAPSPLTFAVAACAHYEHGYYTAYRRLAEQEPELVVHLGDYMYEYAPQGYTAIGGAVRQHTPGKCETLADYRMRHAQYKSDPDLQAARAAPWLVAFDDHEVENNWAAGVSSTGAPAFARRRANAFRAYYENMPLRRSSVPGGASMRVHRRVDWGRWPGSTCSTPASSATTRPARTASGRAATNGWRRSAPCWARTSGAGCSTGSRPPRPGGTWSASRSSWPSATTGWDRAPR